MRNDRKNLIVDITFEFSLGIIEYVERLEKDRKFVVANQLLKSGTSIGQIQEKLKIQKAKLTSSTNLRSPPKRQTKFTIGSTSVIRRIVPRPSA